MRTTMLCLSALILAATLHSASAFEVDHGAAKDGTARFTDPDETIPFPHVADDGQPANSFQAQPTENTSLSFGFTPSDTNQPDAFQRAQDRMQQ